MKVKNTYAPKKANIQKLKKYLMKKNKK